jgi:hypothetical protein
MKLDRAKYDLKLSIVILTVLSFAAVGVAETPCGNETFKTACTDAKVGTCGQPATGSGIGTPCKVRISQTGNVATATAQNVVTPTQPTPHVGRATDPICVAGGTKIVWITLEADSFFNVAFGPSHPFDSNPLTPIVFQGNSSSNKSDSGVAVEAGCYTYSMDHCIRGHACAHTDPKVIVQGTGIE